MFCLGPKHIILFIQTTFLKLFFKIPLKISWFLQVPKFAFLGEKSPKLATLVIPPDQLTFSATYSSAHISGDLNPGLVGVYPPHLLYKLGA
jgi:hypothetical protein